MFCFCVAAHCCCGANVEDSAAPTRVRVAHPPSPASGRGELPPTASTCGCDEPKIPLPLAGEGGSYKGRFFRECTILTLKSQPIRCSLVNHAHHTKSVASLRFSLLSLKFWPATVSQRLILCVHPKKTYPCKGGWVSYANPGGGQTSVNS